MKRKISFILLIPALLLCHQSLPAYSKSDFDKILEFSTSLKNLEQSAFLENGKLLLLNGTVSNLQVLDKEKESFKIMVEIVAGEWIGLDEVRSYRCFVLFAGKDFFSIFPSRKPKNPSAEMIFLNDRIILLAKASPSTEEMREQGIWLLDGLHVRQLQ
ncbi:MAG: hypothetical protein GH155_02230 [Spirochaeta sp.]|nr:hypothetical protein [Spirochaeta sp.]